MASASSNTLQQYQQPLWGRMEPALRNCFVGAGILGVVFLIVVFVVPVPVLKPMTVTDVPERLARLILEKPQRTKPTPKAGGGGGGGGVTQSPKPAPATPAPAEVARPRTPGAPPARRISPPQVATDRGVQGRQRAQKEVSESVAQVTGSLDKVLNSLSQQLPASTAAGTRSKAGVTGSARASSGAPTRGRRAVRSGRTSEQLATVGGVSSLSSADVSGSAIQSEGVSIGMITDLAVGSGGGAGLGGWGEGTGGGSGGGSGGGIGTGLGDGVGSGSGGGSGSGSGGGVGSGVGSGRGDGPSGANNYRSNESLLSVVRRYAPGIQFCYDNELKRNPGLRGKLVVSLVVLANGTVSEAAIVEDSLQSPSVRECVLAQIRGWQFPAIPSGSTSFKTPFVFTPPN
jgi:TonB family protein